MEQRRFTAPDEPSHIHLTRPSRAPAMAPRHPSAPALQDPRAEDEAAEGGPRRN